MVYPAQKSILYLLVMFSGFATLSWEAIWQIKLSLALGESAYGAAITLAVVMGGMSLGAYLMGNVAKTGRVYGLLEISIGLSGLLLNSTFGLIEKVDTWAYTQLPIAAGLIYLLCIGSVLSIPTICMGATFPLMARIAADFQLELAMLYSLNTLGAAIGILAIALFVIPLIGMTHTIWVISIINLLLGVLAYLYLTQTSTTLTLSPPIYSSISTRDLLIVFLSGFATFTLEIAWFRSLENVFPNTTDIFAIMLACVLIGLAWAANDVIKLRQKNKSLSMQLIWAGSLILLITPIIERLDIVIFSSPNTTGNTNLSLSWLLNPVSYKANGFAVLNYIAQLLLISFLSAALIIVPIRFLGRVFPWIIGNYLPQQNAKLYAINTCAAIVGSITAAWILLPTLGLTKTAWFAGLVVLIGGILYTPGNKKFIGLVTGIASLVIAIHFETGIGKNRAQGYFAKLDGQLGKVLAFYASPTATIAALEFKDGARALLINSATAAGESGTNPRESMHYMAWMGHLPMLLQANPKNALVICFGSGQTANAVRNENPYSLDIVDLNAQIFKLAPYFRSNQDVLHDSRVKTFVTDGRAFLRRSKKNL